MKNDKQSRFLKLYEPVHEGFVRYCRARASLEMPYEDLVNESILIAFHKLEELQEEKLFLAFLFGISRKVLANAKRKKRPELLKEEDSFLTIPDPHNSHKSLSDNDLLYYGLAQLGAQQREAIILFELSGYAIKEIALLQESSVSAVKQRLRRGRENLSKILRPFYSSTLKDNL